MEQMNFISEVDTLTQTLRAVHGQFGDIVCCIFEHETVSQLRHQNNEFIEIRSPRIAMLLAGLRLDKLLMHAAMVFQMMPELRATPMGEIGGNMLQRQFFQMLPTDFTKQDVVKQAQVLGISVDTMKQWLKNIHNPMIFKG